MIAANRIFLSAIFLAMAISPAAAQQSKREIVTTANSDYLGFDLRSEKNVSLDQCKSMCLSDPKCKAFTFNTRVNWCFLKSDFDEISQFQGAIAGKVVESVNEADLGAPPKLEFVSAGILDQAHALARRAEKEHKSGATGSADEFMDSAVQSLGSNETLDAARNFASAAALEPENGARWLEIAERTSRWLEVNNNSDYRLQEVASSAAILAYELSRTASTRAHALVVLAKALENRSQYRPALEAYKKSLELKNSEEVAAAYKELREKRGFRVTGNSVEADEAAPSICVTFSEDLVKSGVDYSSFVTLDGKSSGAIEASGQSICAQGLEHGNTYRLTLRAGLPSAVGEVLDSPVVINSYIRDRDPAVRFTGEGFVLPSAARHAIPIVGINATSADLTLYRIGERALPDLLSGSQFLTQLEGYSAESIGDESGQKMWEGKIDLVRERNRDAVTAVPVEEILAKRRARRLCADRRRYRLRERKLGAAGDAMVPGLRHRPVDLRRRRRLDRGRPFARQRQCDRGGRNPVGGAQQRSARLGLDRRRWQGSFAAGLMRGVGGMRAAGSDRASCVPARSTIFRSSMFLRPASTCPTAG